MEVLPICNTEAAQALGATHLIKVRYTDLNDTAGTTKTLTPIASIAANTLFQYQGHVLITDFDGGATSELVFTAGYDLSSGTDDADGYAGSTSVHADATEIDAGPVEITDVATDTVDGTYGAEESTVIASLRTKLNSLLKLQPVCHNEAWDFELAWTSTGANLDALTAGEVWFLVSLVNLDQLEKQAR